MKRRDADHVPQGEREPAAASRSAFAPACASWPVVMLRNRWLS